MFNPPSMFNKREHEPETRKMEEENPEIKRRKLNEDDFNMEISSDDPDDIENLWTTLPPDIVNAVLSRLPYEKCGQLAQACQPWERTYGKLLEPGFLWAAETTRKWQAYKWPPLFRAEDFATLNSMWQDLIFALRSAELLGKGCFQCSEKTIANFRKDFVIIGQKLDRAERCHRDMLYAIRVRVPRCPAPLRISPAQRPRPRVSRAHFF